MHSKTVSKHSSAYPHVPNAQRPIGLHVLAELGRGRHNERLGDRPVGLRDFEQRRLLRLLLTLHGVVSGREGVNVDDGRVREDFVKDERRPGLAPEPQSHVQARRRIQQLGLAGVDRLEENLRVEALSRRHELLVESKHAPVSPLSEEALKDDGRHVAPAEGAEARLEDRAPPSLDPDHGLHDEPVRFANAVLPPALLNERGTVALKLQVTQVREGGAHELLLEVIAAELEEDVSDDGAWGLDGLPIPERARVPSVCKNICNYMYFNFLFHIMVAIASK